EEDGVEAFVQTHRAHVAQDVAELRVDRLALRQHPLGQVGQRDVVMRLQVQRVRAATGAELEHRPDGSARQRLEGPVEERRPFLVVVRMRERVVPVRELAVEARLRHGISRTRPNALRLSMYACAFAASFSGNVRSITTRRSPFATSSMIPWT